MSDTGEKPRQRARSESSTPSGERRPRGASSPSRKKPPAAIDVDLELCKSCGICAALCPSEVFDRDDLGQPVVARLGDCTSCSFCERHCPDFAIEIRWRRGRRGARAGGGAGTPAAGARRAARTTGRPS